MAQRYRPSLLERRSLLALAVSQALVAGPGAAAVFTVDSSADGGAGTLRQAVLDANANAGADQIVFAPGLFPAGGSGSITLGSELAITDPLVIDGDQDDDGNPDVTVQGDGSSRVFRIDNTTAGFEGLRISNGVAGGGDEGGGIAAYVSTVTLNACSVSGNRTGNGRGGGIYGFSSVLNITRSTISGNLAANGEGGGIAIKYHSVADIRDSSISGNQAGQSGGGIYSKYFSRLTLSDSTVSGNIAGGDGGGISHTAGQLDIRNSRIADNRVTGYNPGGGLSLVSGPFAGDSAITISESTISGNSAPNHAGGGIFHLGYYGYHSRLDLARSTVSGNQAYYAGGLFNESVYAGNTTVNVVNSTISGNAADSYAGGVSNYSYHGNAALTLLNSTLAGNSATAVSGLLNYLDTPGSATLAVSNSIVSGGGSGNGVDCDDVGGSPAVNLRNLIRDGTCAPALTADPRLGPLQDNGGPTETHALPADSPAVDAGDNLAAAGLATDQRGDGFSRIRFGTVDIGAYELQSRPIPTLWHWAQAALAVLLSLLAVLGFRRGAGPD